MIGKREGSAEKASGETSVSYLDLASATWARDLELLRLPTGGGTAAAAAWRALPPGIKSFFA